MTVCVAAIFERTGIVAASDRMLTAGDIQYEPAAPKARYLTSSCIALIAGDAYLQAEILQRALEQVGSKIDEDSSRWLRIGEIAGIYKKAVDEAVGELAEQRILSPFGLTRELYLSRQSEFSADFVNEIANEMLNFESPEVEAIICGIDEKGPHIYTVDTNSVQCCDLVGFASVGGGAWHANSQMMSLNHTGYHKLAETLMAVFFAKKRAEIAPGVGAETDMQVVIGLGGADVLNEKVQKELEKRYAEDRRKQKTIADKTREKINNYVEEIISGKPKREQDQLPPAAGDSNTPPTLEAGEI